jgi:hypothetical protein
MARRPCSNFNKISRILMIIILWKSFLRATRRANNTKNIKRRWLITTYSPSKTINKIIFSINPTTILAKLRKSQRKMDE